MLRKIADYPLSMALYDIPNKREKIIHGVLAAQAPNPTLDFPIKQTGRLPTSTTQIVAFACPLIKTKCNIETTSSTYQTVMIA
jgi:hypothetical protein